MREKLMFTVLLFLSGAMLCPAANSNRLSRLTNLAAQTGNLPQSFPGESIAKLSVSQTASLRQACGVAGPEFSGSCVSTILPGVLAAEQLLPNPLDDQRERGFDRIFRLEHDEGSISVVYTEQTKFVFRKKALESAGAELVVANGISMAASDAAIQRFVPNDPLLPQQDHLAMVDPFASWAVLRGKQVRPVTVVVMDTGLDASHPDMVVNRTASFSPAGKDPLKDPMNHGTHVAGTICATPDNTMGVAGLIPSCNLISVAVFTYDEKAVMGGGAEKFFADDASLLRAYLEIGKIKGQPLVVNNSFAGYGKNPFITEAVSAIEGLVVAAVGNDGTDTLTYPCALAIELGNVICVTGIRADHRFDPSLNFGKQVTIAALATTLSTVSGGGYALAGGTSNAGPVVAGVAGLLWQRAEAEGLKVTPAMLRQALEAGKPNPSLYGVIGNPVEANVEYSWAALLRLATGESIGQPSGKLKITSVVDAWSGANAQARGGIVSLYGSGFLGGSDRSFSAADLRAVPKGLVTKVEGIGSFEVQLNGQPIPCSFVSDGQANCFLPMDTFSLWPGENTLATIRKGPNGLSLPGMWDMVKITPFPLYPKFLFQDGKLVVGKVSDDLVAIYATGLGVTNPQLRPGLAGTGNEQIVAPVSVTAVGADGSETPAAGAAAVASPASAGLYEIRISATALEGAVAVRVKVGDIAGLPLAIPQ